MKSRSLVLASAGLIAAFSLSSCTTNSPSDAARVNGRSLKMTDMVRLTTAYDTYQTQSQTGSTTVLTDPTKLPNTATLGTLRQITAAEISIIQVEDRLTKRNTPITDDVRKNLRGQYETQAGWNQLSPLVQDLFVEIGVVKQAISSDATLSKPDPGESIWVNPELGQYSPGAGIVPIGTPIPTTPATSTGTGAETTDTAAASADATPTTTADTTTADTAAPQAGATTAPEAGATTAPEAGATTPATST